jgi:hypothetical protein
MTMSVYMTFSLLKIITQALDNKHTFGMVSDKMSKFSQMETNAFS